MDSKPKSKNTLGCNTVVESTPRPVNDTGYREGPARYMADPKKHFNDALKKALDKWGNKK